jgi:hypothetical protein
LRWSNHEETVEGTALHGGGASLTDNNRAQGNHASALSKLEIFFKKNMSIPKKLKV